MRLDVSCKADELLTSSPPKGKAPHSLRRFPLFSSIPMFHGLLLWLDREHCSGSNIPITILGNESPIHLATQLDALASAVRTVALGNLLRRHARPAR